MSDKKKGTRNVVQMGNRKNMKTIIEAAKEKAERELNEKLELSCQPGVDIRDVISAEEFNEICRRNESFRGTKLDFTKLQLHNKIAMVARWMYERSIEVIAYHVEPPSKDRPNAIVCIDYNRFSYLRDVELKAFASMLEMSDSVVISGIAEGVIRVTCGVERIWDN